MKVAIAVLLAASAASAQVPADPSLPTQPIIADALGPNRNIDATGRPFEWVPTVPGAPVVGPVEPDTFGVGVGRAVDGRPVVAEPWPQE